MLVLSGARLRLALSLLALLIASPSVRAMELRAGLASEGTPPAKRLFGATEDEDDVIRRWREDRGELRLDSAPGPEAEAPRHFHRRRPRRLVAGDQPASGFLRRTAALTIAWATQPLKFDRHDWQTTGVFFAIPLTLILSGSDDKTYRLITGSRTAAKDRFAEFGDQFGAVPVAAGILTAFGLYGSVFDDPRGVHVFESGFISTALAGALTTSLKAVTGRARPLVGGGSRQFNPVSGDLSFPSGHATVAFSLAGVINYHYPGWIGRSALLVACSTGYARVYKQSHWASDVVFAAMISTATANCVSRLNLAAAHGDLTIEPLFDAGGAGLQLRRRF